MTVTEPNGAEPASRNTLIFPTPEEAPRYGNDLRELKIVGHSTLLYWWPVWLAGYIMAAITYFTGDTVELDQTGNEYIHESSNLGVTFIVIMLLAILVTSVKVRGVYSFTMVLGATLLAAVFAWLGWWDDILSTLPNLSVHMNMGFYVVFSTALFVIWLAMFCIFDRLTCWRVSRGEIAPGSAFGSKGTGAAIEAVRLEQYGGGLFRHAVFGLGAGDIRVMTRDPKRPIVDIPNVLFAHKKVRAIGELTVVEPEHD